ncbi:MAG: tRNA dihydrouridine synthase DusB [Firmicutes bacterium]|nr:tRNA dihydrouridine synthase DusB [Bacillota bacterium]
MSGFKIGDVFINHNIVLAPMAGVSNSAYRRICKLFGNPLVVAEMVSDKAIVFENKKTLELLKMQEIERPISQQIFGSDVESFVKAAKKVEVLMHPDIIDINMGCPVPKVAIKNQAGSALLKNPDKIFEIVSQVVAAVNVPVTVKIRSGWDENSINAVEVAKICEKAKASAITIHARTRKQGYSGLSDWALIKKVVEAVNIPVIGNGDIKTCYDAKKMLTETGCQAVMIGRGLIGNPWLIKECIEYLEKGIEPKEISLEEKLNIVKTHLDYLIEDKGEKIALLEMRYHIMHYLKGLPDTKELKLKIMQTKTKVEFLNCLHQYQKLIIKKAENLNCTP